MTVVTCWLRGGERWGLIVRWCVAPRDVARDETGSEENIRRRRDRDRFESVRVNFTD